MKRSAFCAGEHAALLDEVAFLDCDVFHMRICGANTIWMVDAHIERPADLASKADMACRSCRHWRIWLSFVFPATVARGTDVYWAAKPINHPSRYRRDIACTLLAQIYPTLIYPVLISSAPPAAIAKIACKIACI